MCVGGDCTFVLNTIFFGINSVNWPQPQLWPDLNPDLNPNINPNTVPSTRALQPNKLTTTQNQITRKTTGESTYKLRNELARQRNQKKISNLSRSLGAMSHTNASHRRTRNYCSVGRFIGCSRASQNVRKHKPAALKRLLSMAMPDDTQHGGMGWHDRQELVFFFYRILFAACSCVGSVWEGCGMVWWWCSAYVFIVTNSGWNKRL